MHNTNKEPYKRFTQQVRKNHNMVFTMNPSTDNFKDRADTSPNLYNRCVLK